MAVCHGGWLSHLLHLSDQRVLSLDISSEMLRTWPVKLHHVFMSVCKY